MPMDSLDSAPMELSPSFSSLPAELRLQIYRYLFSPAPTPIAISIRFAQNESRPSQSQDDESLSHQPLVYKKPSTVSWHPNVLRLNRTIYYESLPILYKQCIFTPSADARVISAFFSRMTDFARANVHTLLLHPRHRMRIPIAGSQPEISGQHTVEVWGPACEMLRTILPDLRELRLCLLYLYMKDLRAGRNLDWLTTPLSFMPKVKRILDKTSESPALADCTERWNGMIQSADARRAEQVALIRPGNEKKTQHNSQLETAPAGA